MVKTGFYFKQRQNSIFCLHPSLQIRHSTLEHRSCCFTRSLYFHDPYSLPFCFHGSTNRLLTAQESIARPPAAMAQVLAEDPKSLHIIARESSDGHTQKKGSPPLQHRLRKRTLSLDYGSDKTGLWHSKWTKNSGSTSDAYRIHFWTCRSSAHAKHQVVNI